MMKTIWIAISLLLPLGIFPTAASSLFPAPKVVRITLANPADPLVIDGITRLPRHARKDLGVDLPVRYKARRQVAAPSPIARTIVTLNISKRRTPMTALTDAIPLLLLFPVALNSVLLLMILVIWIAYIAIRVPGRYLSG